MKGGEPDAVLQSAIVVLDKSLPQCYLLLSFPILFICIADSLQQDTFPSKRLGSG